MYRGKYIDFEAKECQSKTAFSLSYIHPHQITHLEKCRKHGGICFVIFRLTYHNLTYLVDAQEMIDYIRGIERKSIPYKWIMTHGHSIQSYYGRPVDYLEVVDRLYFKNEEVTNVISKKKNKVNKKPANGKRKFHGLRFVTLLLAILVGFELVLEQLELSV